MSNITEQDILDFANGVETPGSLAYAEIVKRISASQHKAWVAGDPLNITGHTPPKVETKQEVLARQKERGKRWVKFWTPSGSQVEIDLKKNPLLGIYRTGEISAPQFAAANRFVQDWETAHYSGLSCRGFEPGVDNRPMPSANLGALDAQRALIRVRDLVGQESMLILEAVLVNNVTFSEIESNGGGDKRGISAKLKTALERMATFIYFYQEEVDTRTSAAIKKMKQHRRDHPYR